MIMTRKRWVKVIQGARDIAAVARKGTVTDGARERFANAEVIYQVLLDALNNPSIK